MVTVQHLVKHELGRKPILIELLQQDLLNVSAVAVKLHPNVKTALGKDVKITAISMAIRRLCNELSEKQMFKWKFPQNLEISSKSGIYEISIKKGAQLAHLLPSIQKKLKKQIGDFISCVDGTYETVLLTNQHNKNIIKSMLKGMEITSEKNNLGYLSLNFEPYTKDIPGVYYQITRALAFCDLPIQSMHTMGSELIMLFKNEDLIESYKIVKNTIDNGVIF